LGAGCRYFHGNGPVFAHSGFFKERMMRTKHGKATNGRGATNGVGSHVSNGNGAKASLAMKIPAYFCPEGAEPFDTVQWDQRSAQIKDENGKILFEQKNCEVPVTWSALATNVVVSKYFYGEANTAEREHSVRQVIHRVARTIADWGTKDGYFDTPADGEQFYKELAWLCLHQHGCFNSPVWFNVGLYHQYGVKGGRGNYRWDTTTSSIQRAETPYEFPQASACFIQSVDDNMEDIMRLATSEAMLFKFGSGTGTDLSTIRSSKEKLSGGGVPSGPLSFMRVYDQIAAVVKSGGKTRRAAKMQSLKDWHPDIVEFIQAKAREERKARTLIASGEYEANFNGEAYSSIMFQNANLSVRVSDEFMQAAEDKGKWQTHWVTSPDRKGPEYDAEYMLRQIAEGTWYCGDPGVQYDTTINRWHTCPETGPINASNPCSEYMFLDDTACNLSSLNLKKFLRDDGTFDVERYRRAAAIFITAQEILVDHASYPTPMIAENSHRFRPLGLGYANLGSLLMTMGIPYDSDAGRGICGALTALLNGQAYLSSSEMAANVGPFAGYREQRSRRLLRRHGACTATAVEQARSSACACPDVPADRGPRCAGTNAYATGARRTGIRNAQATVLAPTGTIGFMMDCDTTGVEPDYRASVKYKQLAGGGDAENRQPHGARKSLRTLGYTPEPQVEAIVTHIDSTGTIRSKGRRSMKAEHLAVFDCSLHGRRTASGSIRQAWAHVGMMGAAQPFHLRGDLEDGQYAGRVDGGRHRWNAYLEGWRLGLQGARDLPRRVQEQPAPGHHQRRRPQEKRVRGAGCCPGSCGPPRAGERPVPPASAGDTSLADP
jgi:ribonucleoside-diphosphate reductase alpha chain